MSAFFNSISHVLKLHLVKNTLVTPITVSPGEGLLLVLETLLKAKFDDPDTQTKLKKLYLEGVRTKEDKQFFDALKTFLSELGYDLSYDPDVINNDSTRRYFETHLAYNLISEKSSLTIESLTEYTENLKASLFLSKDVKSDRVTKVNKILEGMPDSEIVEMLKGTKPGLTKYELEYAQLIYKLKNNQFFVNDKPQAKALDKSTRALEAKNKSQEIQLYDAQSYDVPVYEYTPHTHEPQSEDTQFYTDAIYEAQPHSVKEYDVQSDDTQSYTEHQQDESGEPDLYAPRVCLVHSEQELLEDNGIQCKKLVQIASSTILATLNTQYNKVPVDIYTDSIFTMGMEGRGRIVKKDHEGVKTYARGIMRAKDPLPAFDVVHPVSFEVPLEDQSSPFQRSADQASFMIESQWSQKLFSRLTQVYSNGISSTTLAQLRNLIFQMRLGQHYFKNQFHEYIVLFSGLMVYNSGGHSFFEILEVLKLTQFRDLIKNNKGLSEALNNDELMSYCFFTSRQNSFDKTLNATLKYMRTVLNNRMVNVEFKESVRKVLSTKSASPQVPVVLENAVNEFIESSAKSNAVKESQRTGISISTHEDYIHQMKKELLSAVSPTKAKQTTLHSAVLTMSPKDFEHWLKCTYKGDINAENNKKWTALMVAAQNGKTEHVAILLKAKAKVDHKVESENLSLSALELAIKRECFDTVELLVNNNAEIFQKNVNSNEELRKRSPAIYLACKHNNMQILKFVLCKNERMFNTDIEKALLIALKVENFNAVNTIKNSIPKDSRKKIFTVNFKAKLLEESVSLGSPKLINFVKKNILFRDEPVNYQHLLSVAIGSKYLVVARELLKLYWLDKRAMPEISSLKFTKLLEQAFVGNQYNFVLLLMLYGADLKSISLLNLKQFEEHLKQKPNYTFLKEMDPNFLKRRAGELQQSVDYKANNLYFRIIELIVDFINFFLPEDLKIVSLEKKKTLVSIFSLFEPKDPPSNLPAPKELDPAEQDLRANSMAMG